MFPSLGRVRSIRDIQDRIAESAARKQPGEWIVTMPIGDPPYYFDVPEILAEKRWPTRQELDAAAPNNPVFIRSIWGFWRGTFPLVSCANTEALKRAGITRDTVSPVDTADNREGRQWRSDRRVRRARDAADRRTDLVPRGDAHSRRADRLRALPQSAQRLSRLRHHERVRGARRRDRIAPCLQGSRARRDADHAHRARLQSRTGRQRRRTARALRGGLGWLARRARARRRLAQDERALRSRRPRTPPTTCARAAAPYTGWAGFNYDPGLPRDQVKELLLHARRTTSARSSPSDRQPCSISTTRSTARFRSKGGAG